MGNDFNLFNNLNGINSNGSYISTSLEFLIFCRAKNDWLWVGFGSLFYDCRLGRLH